MYFLFVRFSSISFNCYSTDLESHSRCPQLMNASYYFSKYFHLVFQTRLSYAWAGLWPNTATKRVQISTIIYRCLYTANNNKKERDRDFPWHHFVHMVILDTTNAKSYQSYYATYMIPMPHSNTGMKRNSQVAWLLIIWGNSFFSFLNIDLTKKLIR